MRKISILLPCFLAVLLLVGGVGMAEAETQLRQLGQNPFYGPEIKSNADFRRMVRETLAELKVGFAKAGAADLFDDFVSQSEQPDIREIEVNPGERFQWMIFRKGETIKVVKDVVWLGKEPFAAFIVNVDKAGNRYTFVVPAKCGNVSLAMITPLPPARPVANIPPACKVAITPLTVVVGKDITIDGSQSVDPDGSIAAMFVQIANDNNAIVAQNDLQKPPFVHHQPMTKVGNYLVRVSVTDDKGLESSAPDCPETKISVVASRETVVDEIRRGHFVADIGVMHQPDPATYLLMRVGYDYRFTDRFSLLGMVGFAPVIDGHDDDDSLMADVTANFHHQRMFFGAGVGAWHSSMDDRLDLIVTAGYRLYGDPFHFNMALFVEGRGAVDQLDELNDYGRLGIGLRFQF